MLFAIDGKTTAINVRVEITEIDHSHATRLGVDWLDRVRVSENLPAGILKIGSVARATPLQTELNFLIQEGAAELLANPTLRTDSGTTAVFHAGGQIPYVTTASLGGTNVEFKPYGVELEIRPTLQSSGQIGMRIKAAVSEPDASNGVLLSGNTVPALLERSVDAEVTVDPGETMVLAGLVQSVRVSSERGVPFLRRIPLLGYLFRWRQVQVRKSTVIVFVTPDAEQL